MAGWGTDWGYDWGSTTPVDATVNLSTVARGAVVPTPTVTSPSNANATTPG